MYLGSRLLANLLVSEMDDLWTCCVEIHSMLTAEPSAPPPPPSVPSGPSGRSRHRRWVGPFGNVSSDALFDAERQDSIKERSNRAIRANKV